MEADRLKASGRNELWDTGRQIGNSGISRTPLLIAGDAFPILLLAILTANGEN